MRIVKVTQGSDEWLAVRAKRYTASEAPAMMGTSPYMTRSELLRQKATGIDPEIDAAKQALFDRGHALEAFARPLAEERIGEGLFPVTAADDDDLLMASFDGLTMDGGICWECKTANDLLRSYIEDGDIPDSHWPQVEQQLLISGAAYCLFTITDGTVEGTQHLEYRSWPERRASVVAGWKQFDADLAAYVPPEIIPAPVAAPQSILPAVTVQVFGSLEVRDNLSVFGDALAAYVDRINKNPQTDDDFATLEATVKKLKEAEAALDAAESGAIGQAGSIDALRRTIGEYRDLSRQNRLVVERLVKAEKENRRNAIVQRGHDALNAHVSILRERTDGNMPDVEADFSGKVKGLKTLSSIQNAVDTELARAKIEANSISDRIERNLAHLHTEANDYEFLFADVTQIVLKAPDDFAALVKMRIEEHKSRQVDQRGGAQCVPSISEAGQGTAHGLRQEQAATPDNGLRIRLGAINSAISPLSITSAGLEQLGVPHVGTDKAAKLYRQCDLALICRALAKHLEDIAASEVERGEISQYQAAA